jgi:hypothetical protein
MDIFPTKLNLREQEVVHNLINKNRLFWACAGFLAGVLVTFPILATAFLKLIY